MTSGDGPQVMWRGERLALAQLADPGQPPVEQLICGLTWRIPGQVTPDWRPRRGEASEKNRTHR